MVPRALLPFPPFLFRPRNRPRRLRHHYRLHSHRRGDPHQLTRGRTLPGLLPPPPPRGSACSLLRSVNCILPNNPPNRCTLSQGRRLCRTRGMPWSFRTKRWWLNSTRTPRPLHNQKMGSTEQEVWRVRSNLVALDPRERWVNKAPPILATTPVKAWNASVGSKLQNMSALPPWKLWGRLGRYSFRERPLRARLQQPQVLTPSRWGRFVHQHPPAGPQTTGRSAMRRERIPNLT